MTLDVTYSRPGAPTDTLEVTDIGAIPAPGSNQIQVKVAAFSIHPGDLLGIACRQTHGTPVVAGVEATGVVTATGPGVTSYTLRRRELAAARASLGSSARIAGRRVVGRSFRRIARNLVGNVRIVLRRNGYGRDIAGHVSAATYRDMASACGGTDVGLSYRR
jgi:NADPH:quinone reductase-like Zn-dependent oxidoreductase